MGRYTNNVPTTFTFFKFVGLSVRKIWLLVSALVDLVTLKLLMRVIARGVGNLHTNFGFTRTFCSGLIGQHLSDELRDLDLWGHGACRWCGSSYSVCVPSLKFVRLPVWKILGIYCVSIIRPDDLWPLNRFTGYSCDGLPASCQIWTS